MKNFTIKKYRLIIKSNEKSKKQDRDKKYKDTWDNY